MSSTGPIVDLTGTPFGAGTTPEWTFQITDAAGNPIAGSSLFSLTVTIFDTPSGIVINGVKDDTTRVSCDAQGNVTVALKLGDTALLNPADGREYRSLLVFWTYNGGVSEGWRQGNCLILAPGAT